MVDFLTQNLARLALETYVLPSLDEPIRYSPVLQASLADLIRSVKAQGLEGLVGKNRTSRYELAQRSGFGRRCALIRGKNS